jgi:hypothetical protein
LQPFDAVVWIDPQEVEDEAVFGFAVPVALPSHVGCFYLRQNSLGRVSAHELSIERRSVAFLVLKPRRENLGKLWKGLVGQKAESVPVDGEDAAVDVGMDLFEKKRAVGLVASRWRSSYIAQLRVADLAVRVSSSGYHGGEFEAFPEDGRAFLSSGDSARNDETKSPSGTC